MTEEAGQGAAARPAATFAFTLFGRFSARRIADGDDVTPRGRKARALLAYLLLERRPVDRERLAGLLWSERGQAQANASLRQCLLELRPFAQDADPLLAIRRHQAAAAGPAELDVDRIAELAARGEAEGVATLLAEGEALLEDLDGLDPAFDQWLRGTRTGRGEALLAAAKQACREAIDAGRPDGALQLARQLQRIDPLDEGAARLAMEAAHSLGQREGVALAYECTRKALRDELGIEPAPETRTLYERLLANAPPPSAASLEPAAAPARNPSAEALPAEAPRTAMRARLGFPAVAFAVALAALLFALWRGQSGPEVPTVAVVAQQPSAEPLTQAFSVDLARLAAARPGTLSVVDPTAADESDYAVRVAAGESGGNSRIDLSLLARGRPELLWSARLERPTSEAADLRQQASAILAGVLLCAGTARAGSLPDPETEKLFLTACEQADDPPNEERLALLRQIVRRAPAFARVLAMLAEVEAALAGSQAYTIQGDRNPRSLELAEAAREHLLRARELDPSLGQTYAAEADLIFQLSRVGERIALIERGISVDPDNPSLHSARSFMLSAVGRMAEAVASARRAAELNPISPTVRSALILTLAHAGRPEVANRELSAAERIWPGSTAMREARYAFNLRYGDPADALRMLDGADARGVSGGVPQRIPMERAFLRARIDPTPGNVEAALGALGARVSSWHRMASFYTQALAAFGRVDEVYAYIGTYDARSMDVGIAQTLFRPFMRDVWRDRRFMPLMARAGLLQYWQASGRWPDLCFDPELPYDCRAEARRLLGRAT